MDHSKYRKLMAKTEPSILIVLALGIVFWGLITSSDWLWRNKILKNLPLYDNLMQARVALTKGQVLLESILAGDQTIRVEDIWPFYDKSELAVRDCINGRSTILNLSGIPPDDGETLNQLQQLGKTLKRFRELALARWKTRESTELRSTLDERALFYRLERTIDAIDYRILQNIGMMLKDQKKIHSLSLILWLLILSVVCGILHFNGKIRRKAEAELRQAHDELEKQVEARTSELTYTNQELNQEIEERKLAEEALSESEATYRALFDNMIDGVAVYKARNNGEDFIFANLNKAGEIISAVSADTVVGQSVLKIFPSVKDFGLFDVFQQVFETGRPVRHPMAQYKDNRISGSGPVYRIAFYL